MDVIVFIHYTKEDKEDKEDKINGARIIFKNKYLKNIVFYSYE